MDLRQNFQKQPPTPPNRPHNTNALPSHSHSTPPQSHNLQSYHQPTSNLISAPPSGSFGPTSGPRPPSIESLVPNPYAPHGGYVPVGAAAALAAHSHASNAGAVLPLSGMEQMVGTNPTNMGWNNQMIHPSSRGKAIKRKVKKNKIAQSAWCELCKVDCNSQEMFDIHKLGKKHNKNLRKFEESKNVVSVEPLAMTKPEDPLTSKEIPPGAGIRAEKTFRKRNSASISEEAIETKRLKLLEDGVAADSLRACNICNVVCNSDSVFKLHLSGQKHAAKVASAQLGLVPIMGTSPNLNLNPGPYQSLVSVQHGILPMMGPSPKQNLNPNPYQNLESPQHGMVPIMGPRPNQNMNPILCHNLVSPQHGMAPITSPRPNQNMNPIPCHNLVACSGQANFPTMNGAMMKLMKKKKSKKAEGVQIPFWCDICNIDCTSHIALNNHILGKKHLKNLEKSEQLKRKRKLVRSKPKEGLRAKKQKVSECGKTINVAKLCTICNVICNSETVYNAHVAGQKHAAILKKLTAAAAISAVGTQMVSGVTSATSYDCVPAPVTASSMDGEQGPTVPTSVPTFIPQPTSA